MTKQTSNKIIIKPFRLHIQMDPNFADNTWTLLRDAIKEIHKKNASNLSFEELYRNAYNMVLHKCGDKLYEGLKSTVDEHLQEVAAFVASSKDSSFLIEVRRAWEDHKLSMLMIRDILMYMDRVYVENKGVLSVYDLGLTLFKSNVARHPKIKDRLQETLLQMIENERNGQVIDRGIIKSITQMLVDLGINSREVYENDFEKAFLSESATFYRQESQEFINSNCCADYMRKVEQRLLEEKSRVDYYLDPSTEERIRTVVERELISNHMRTLIDMENSGLVSMLENDKISDLRRMYTLFQRVEDGLNLMRDVIYQHISAAGKEIVINHEKEERANDASSFVQSLLNLKDKHDTIMLTAFANDKSFLHSMNKAFAYFINLNSKSPEFLSLFIDSKLKKGLKGVSDEEVDQVLDKVMMLFRFIQEKDVFERYYKSHLAKRLLLGRSVSDDAERNMIGKLKTECGYQFTSKLEGMFNDMKISNDTMKKFRAYLSTQPNPIGGIDLNVHVLTMGFWPTQPAANCDLPPEILRCCEIFKQYYLSKHNGRRLTWQTNMGTADLKAFYPKRRHEMNVSTYQMCILLLFNKTHSLTFKEIREATGIPIPELKRNLLSLALPKYRVLLKEPMVKKIEDSDVFKYNEKFRSKLYRVKIMNRISVKESEPERRETREKVDEDRKHQIEAAIVRIMKSRKRMEHSNLISEVTKQLSSRFLPNPLIIKKRIESLIEREYLERSKKDRKMYNYLA